MRIRTTVAVCLLAAAVTACATKPAAVALPAEPFTHPPQKPHDDAAFLFTFDQLELKGTARYRVGDETFTVQAPYVAKVPPGVAHTFVNEGTEPFNLIAVFASKHPSTKRVGPNPLIPAQP